LYHDTCDRRYVDLKFPFTTVSINVTILWRTRLPKLITKIEKIQTVEKNVTLASNTCSCDIVKQLSSLLFAICVSNARKYRSQSDTIFTRYKMPFEYHDGPERSCLELYCAVSTFLSWMLSVRISKCEITRLSFSLVFPLVFAFSTW